MHRHLDVVSIEDVSNAVASYAREGRSGPIQVQGGVHLSHTKVQSEHVALLGLVFDKLDADCIALESLEVGVSVIIHDAEIWSLARSASIVSSLTVNLTQTSQSVASPAADVSTLVEVEIAGALCHVLNRVRLVSGSIKVQ